MRSRLTSVFLIEIIHLLYRVLLLRCKLGVLQYTVVRPVTTVIALWVNFDLHALRFILQHKGQHFVLTPVCVCVFLLNQDLSAVWGVWRRKLQFEKRVDVPGHLQQYVTAGTDAAGLGFVHRCSECYSQPVLNKISLCLCSSLPCTAWCCSIGPWGRSSVQSNQWANSFVSKWWCSCLSGNSQCVANMTWSMWIHIRL